MSPVISIPAPTWPLDPDKVRGLAERHHREGLRLTGQRGITFALSGDPAALVSALLCLAQEALLIHALAEAAPDRPVAEVLTEAVQQMKDPRHAS